MRTREGGLVRGGVDRQGRNREGLAEGCGGRAGRAGGGGQSGGGHDDLHRDLSLNHNGLPDDDRGLRGLHGGDRRDRDDTLLLRDGRGAAGCEQDRQDEHQGPVTDTH